MKPEQVAEDVVNGVQVLHMHTHTTHCTVLVCAISHALLQSGQFTITHGFDGALLGAVTSGFSPVHSLMEGLLQVHPTTDSRVVPWLSSPPSFCRAVQVLLMSAVRLLSFFYIASFNKIVHKHLKATPAGTTAHPH